ncbi:MAG: hypothetical protein AAB947_00690 [Patescibacteria group bacterium]
MKYFDIHLSAELIGRETIRQLESFGFREDFFRNNRNSKPPHYHASYRTHLDAPDNILWGRTVSLLTSAPGFRGCLEEESFGDLRYNLNTLSSVSDTKLCVQPFELETCRPGEHKTCDVHINVNMDRTTPDGLEHMEQFNFISFDRTVGKETRRVYSLTFEDLTLGEEVFHRLYGIFQNIPGLVGKMKRERVTRFMVSPSDAEQLPIVRTTFAKSWLASY